MLLQVPNHRRTDGMCPDRSILIRTSILNRLRLAPYLHTVGTLAVVLVIVQAITAIPHQVAQVLVLDLT